MSAEGIQEHVRIVTAVKIRFL